MQSDPSNKTELESPISELYRRRHAKDRYGNRMAVSENNDPAGAATRQYGPSYSRKTLSKIDAECFFLMMSVTSCSILNVSRRPPE